VEQTFVHLAQSAAWFLVIVFVFALIGVYATTAWIVNMFRRGEKAVEEGVQSVGKRF